MNDNSSTFGLGKKQLQQLFAIGDEDVSALPKTEGVKTRTELLQRRLREPLPLGREQLEVLPAALAQLCSTIGSIAGETIISLIRSSETGISVLQRIKRNGKRLSNHALSKNEQQVGVAIYYGAIASALVYHERRISRLSYSNLADAFERLSNESWMSSDLAMLYRVAREYCGTRSRGGGK